MHGKLCQINVKEKKISNNFLKWIYDEAWGVWVNKIIPRVVQSFQSEMILF